MDWSGLTSRLKAVSPGLLLPLILAVALGLRLYGIGWDEAYGFHPDERSLYMRADCMYDVLAETPGYANGDCFRDNPEMEPGPPSIGTAFDAERSPLNPHWFPLGSILIYLLVVVRLIFELLADLGSLLSTGYIGKSIIAVADVGTVAMVYLLGKRMFSRGVGLLAAALVAAPAAVVNIQYSHFYRPESLLVFFLAGSFWAMLQVVERRRIRDSLLLGSFLGSILIYLLVVIRLTFEPFTDLGSLLSMGYIGRSITAVADVGTVLMVYLLGKQIWSRRVGLLASALVAVAVVHIQHSHFYRPEPLLVFFLAGSFWAMLRVVERRRLRDSLLLGVFVGLTFAAKVSVLPLLLPLALAYGFRLFTTRDGVWNYNPSLGELSRAPLHALAAAAVAVAVFFVTTPYALLDPVSFVGDITYQLDNVAKTAGKVPFTIQYIGSTPFLYELRQTSLWALGLPLGIIAWGGLLFTIAFVIWKLVKGGAIPIGEILLVAWVVPNVIMLSLFEVKFLRYIFPVLPFLVLMGAGMLFRALDKAREVARMSLVLRAGANRAGALALRYAPHAVASVIVLVVVATAFYGIAFERVYSRPHTAIQASDWMREYLPPNSAIVMDNHWTEWVPNLHGYQVRQIPIYDLDTVSKMENIAGLLSQGDYLLFYSNFTYGSVARQPERYPLSSHYYRMLFEGKLGYSVEKVFTSYPQLLGVSFVDNPFGRAQVPEPESLKEFAPGGISINMGYADENVTNYDHPRVLLFRNVGGLSRAELVGRLTEPATLRLGTLMSPLPEDPGGGELGLMLSPAQKATQRAGGTWSDIIKRDSWTNKVPVLAWLLLVEIIYLAALPLATFLFRPLPDRGIVLARILGILGVAYVTWLLASIDWMDFSRVSVLVGILTVASLSALVLAFRWREFKEFISRNWRLLAIGEVLFLAAFLSFVAIRWANPDLWHPFRGGEKPMDFAYLNAVLRSTVMPPYDPWFAGGYLNYYYWGQFVVATLIKATGIVPSVAYNLAVPMLFAMTVTGAYSLVYNVTAGIRRSGRAVAEGLSASDPPAEGLEQGPASTSRSWAGSTRGVAWGPVGAGVLAGLFVAVIGNLDGIAQVVKGGWNTLFHGNSYPTVEYLSDFWRSSRMLPELADVGPSALAFWIPDKIFPGAEMGPHITEFPFFSFLFADLHAHMIVIPFTLLAVGLGLSLLVGLREGRREWLAITTVALGVAVGSLWAINSWDYPAYLLLGTLLIGLGAYLRKTHPLDRLGTFLVLAPMMGLVSYLAFLPFHQNYHPFPTGIVVSKWQTPVANFLGIHGLFLFLIGSFLVYLSWRPLRTSVLAGILTAASPPLLVLTSLPLLVLAFRWRAFKELISRNWHLLAIGRVLFRAAFLSLRTILRSVPWTGLGALLAMLIFIYMGVTGYWMAAMLVMFLAFTLWVGKGVLAGKGEAAPFAVLPIALIVMGLLIAIGVEFVRVTGDIGRMNTLFKYYLEVWVLLAMGAAYVLWYLASRGALSLRGLSVFRGAWIAVLAILVGSSFIYTILGTWDRVVDRFDTSNMTLDGTDFMNRAVFWENDLPMDLSWDYDAIKELQDKVEGSPVVLEAWTFQYHWGARIANYTGLPAVQGWGWHQEQQRMEYRDAVNLRIRHVREMYSTQDQERALELLRLYEVEYVIVGQLEQAYYPADGLAKFDAWARDGTAEVMYQNPGVKIYRALWYN